MTIPLPPDECRTAPAVPARPGVWRAHGPCVRRQLVQHGVCPPSWRTDRQQSESAGRRRRCRRRGSDSEEGCRQRRPPGCWWPRPAAWAAVPVNHSLQRRAGLGLRAIKCPAAAAMIWWREGGSRRGELLLISERGVSCGCNPMRSPAHPGPATGVRLQKLRLWRSPQRMVLIPPAWRARGRRGRPSMSSSEEVEREHGCDSRR